MSFYTSEGAAKVLIKDMSNPEPHQISPEIHADVSSWSGEYIRSFRRDGTIFFEYKRYLV